MEKFEDPVGIESFYQVVENGKDREGIHHSNPHFEVPGNFRDHAQEFRKFDTCIHSILTVILGSEPDFPASVCDSCMDIFDYLIWRKRVQFTSCIFYNTIRTGEIAALGDLRDVNIWIEALAWNIEEAHGFGSPKFKACSSGQTFLFSLLD
jgi:hypothetical protein